jgi:DNA-binding NarL/FixJ family response regulator
MPGMDGYSLARLLRGSSRAGLIPIVFLTAKNEPADRIEGFRSGVDVYLTKPCEPAELLAVVANLLSRVERTRGEIAELVGGRKSLSQPLVSDEELTNAEMRIASAVARGLTNKQIAAELKISVRTVENHISHILAKKGFVNRVDIARYALEQSTPTNN